MPSVNSILSNESTYFALWSILSDLDLNHSQSMSWYSLCPHAFITPFTLADLPFFHPPLCKIILHRETQKTSFTWILLIDPFFWNAVSASVNLNCVLSSKPRILNSLKTISTILITFFITYVFLLKSVEVVYNKDM